MGLVYSFIFFWHSDGGWFCCDYAFAVGITNVGGFILLKAAVLIKPTNWQETLMLSLTTAYAHNSLQF